MGAGARYVFFINADVKKIFKEIVVMTVKNMKDR